MVLRRVYVYLPHIHVDQYPHNQTKNLTIYNINIKMALVQQLSGLSLTVLHHIFMIKYGLMQIIRYFKLK